MFSGKYRDFEDFLQNKHAWANPEVLDDDVPDHYDDWLSRLGVETLIELADEFAKIQFKGLLGKYEWAKKDIQELDKIVSKLEGQINAYQPQSR